MAQKQEVDVVELQVHDCVFNWGCWSDLKKRFLEVAAEQVKHYHGDVFIDYQNMQSAINEAQHNKQADINLVIGFHANGTDFIDYMTMSYDTIEILEERLKNNNARCIAVNRTENKDVVAFSLFDWNVE